MQTCKLRHYWKFCHFKEESSKVRFIILYMEFFLLIIIIFMKKNINYIKYLTGVLFAELFAIFLALQVTFMRNILQWFKLKKFLAY